MAAAAAQGPASVTEYIQHHLTNWTWQFGPSSFWTLNLDSLFWSALMGALFLAAFAVALRGRHLAAGPLFAGYVATFVAYWVALVRSAGAHDA